MQRRVVLIALAALAGVALLVWLLTAGGTRQTREELVPAEALPTPTPAPEQRVVLLFAGNDGLLHPELRSVPLPGEVDERIRVVMNELISGPRDRGQLTPVIPYAATVDAVFVDQQGNAFIDLSVPPEPLTGLSTELLLTYGIVDSVILNCPEITAVQLLFGGHEVPTLTGHLDLSKPLVLNKRFIAAS